MSFEQLQAYYFTNVLANSFIAFRVAKCCGYTELVYVPNTANLNDLHKTISCQFGFEVKKIFLRSKPGFMNIEIRCDEHAKLREFLKEMTAYIAPAYPLPTRVIYDIELAGACQCIINL